MRAHLTLKSNNAKTGPIPVSVTDSASCPTGCPHHKTTCYASLGPLAMHWRKVDTGQRGNDWDSFCRQVAALPDGQLWRHNQAGDLPGIGNTINGGKLRQLVAAAKRTKGFTYTHKPLHVANNATKIRAAIDAGFTVNISADSLTDADTAATEGFPVVVVLPSTQTENSVTPAGRTIVVCPATQSDDVTCSTCKLCAVANRKTIVGFPAHGTRRKVIDIRLEEAAQ